MSWPNDLHGAESGRAKYWVFTINNPTPEDFLLLNNAFQEHSFLSYIRFTLEVGENGTPHYQGHLECSSRVRRSQLRPFLPRAWTAVRKGTFEQAEEYCMKDADGSNTHVIGERVSSGQGKRTDLDSLAEDIRSQEFSKRELAATYGKEFIKYSNGIERYCALFTQKKFAVLNGPWQWNISVSTTHSVILWGEAGIGKTEYAKYLLPDALFVSHLDDLGSLNEDYNGIIFDDMAFTHLPRTSQIHLVDMDNDRSIHIRYKVAVIPSHTPKIFLTNEQGGFIFDLNDAAIRRRVEVHHLE